MDNKELILSDSNYNWEERVYDYMGTLVDVLNLPPSWLDIGETALTYVEQSLSKIYSDDEYLPIFEMIERAKSGERFRVSEYDLSRIKQYEEKLRVKDTQIDRRNRRIRDKASKRKLSKSAPDQNRKTKKSKKPNYREMYEEWLRTSDAMNNVNSSIGKFISKIMPRNAKRGRSKSSKSVTRTGVKRLISKRAGHVGDLTLHKQGTFTIRTGTDGGTSIDPDGSGALVYGFRAISGAAFETYDDLTGDNGYADRIQYLFPVPTVGGADQLPSYGVYKITLEKTNVNFLIHNPVNEVVRATFWWLKHNDDQSVSGSATWLTEYQQSDATSSTDFVSRDFYKAFTDTAPTAYGQFNRAFTIVKKYECVFQPGQTREMSCPLNTFTCRQIDLPSGETFLKNLTHHLMVKLEGVPTAQNTAGTYDNTKVAMSPSSLEFFWTLKRRMSVNTSDFKFNTFNADGQGAVTSGRSTVVASASAIAES